MNGNHRVGAHATLVKAYELEWLHNGRIFESLVDYNAAYLLVASGQRLIPEDAAAVLLGCLKELRSEGFSVLPYSSERDGLQPNIEAEVTKRIGPDRAGWLSVGRARQECELVARQIVERNALLDVIEKVSGLLAAMVALAEREKRSLMPFYTWAQHAEPITFGYFMIANANAVAADCQRLRLAMASLDRSRAGAGQIVPPPFDIDREKLARLLGFSDVIPNSLYAYSSLDIEIQIVSALSIFCTNLARLSETFFVWASHEFGFLQFGAEFTGTSYAMPQKKNPYALRLARPVASRATGVLNEAIQLHSGSLQIVGNGLIHIPNRVIALMDEVCVLCDVMAAALPTMSLAHDRMRETLKSGWAQASQFVYYLSGIDGISFRQAHSICGRVVRATVEGADSPALTQALVETAIEEVVGRKIIIEMDELRQALDPAEGIQTRTNGGPAAVSLEREGAILKQTLAVNREFIHVKRVHLADATKALYG